MNRPASPLPFLLPALACLFTPAALAQTFSYDGNRWYEIEVSIFTNEGVGTTNEQVIPEHVTIAYPEPIRQLVPAASVYMVPFPGNMTPEVPDPGFTEAPEPVFIGPEEPSGEGSFTLTDLRRAPYYALGDAAARFTTYDERIERSPEHRVLFHAVWRQPVLNRVQATAIQVSGGDQHGEHHELEGSLRFSYNVNRVDVEANLWLLEFDAEESMDRWQVPEPPLKTDEVPVDTFPVAISGLQYMNQERAMISNDLHYLDHPAMGMLVEIRPYQLPEVTGFSFD